MIEPNHFLNHKAEITLMLDPRETLMEKRLFRCSVCGNIVLEYENPIAFIVPGHSETLATPAVVQCPHSIRKVKPNGEKVFLRCKTRYYVVKEMGEIVDVSKSTATHD